MNKYFLHALAKNTTECNFFFAALAEVALFPQLVDYDTSNSCLGHFLIACLTSSVFLSLYIFFAFI